MYSNSTDLKFSNETTKVSLQNKIGAEACNVLMELRNTGQLCDAVIKVDEESFMIHRAILSACSPYFRVLFTNEKFEINRQEVTITDITVDIMRSIIQFAYTQDCCINHNNVKSLLVAADYFNIIGLLRICSEYLMSQLNAHNCIGIEKFAQMYFCQELQQVAHRYLMVNFSEVYKVSNEFLQLNVANVCEIFASDELNVRSEEITFNAIVRWVDYDPGTRVEHIGQLLQTMRLGLLSTEYFVEKVKSHEYIKDNTSCKPVVIETLKFLCNLDVEKELKINQNNHITRPRLPHDILFIFGGWSGNSTTNIIETYDSRADLWVKNTNTKSDYRAYHGTCVLDRLIYIIGGFDGTEYFNSVRCFDPLKQIWSEAAPMYTKRCYISVVVLHSFIYAMGGYDGQVRQNTAERYNKSKNQWSFIQPMHHQRSDASATVLYDHIYICGGFDGQEILNSAEYYESGLNQWTLISPMLSLRSGVRIVAHNHFLYALGGFNGASRLSSVERYNHETNSWENVSEMDTPRSNFAIEVLEGMIFAIGGFDGFNTISHVECYDTVSEQWYKTASLNINRSALSACVIEGLPNVKPYISERDRKECSSSGNTKSIFLHSESTRFSLTY